MCAIGSKVLALVLLSSAVRGFAPLHSFHHHRSPSCNIGGSHVMQGEQRVQRKGGEKSTSSLMSLPDPVDTVTSGLASICRLQAGVTVDEKRLTKKATEASQDGDKGLPVLKRLYDVENSQSCRKVRESITELDLNVETVIPSASNSRVFNDPSYQYYIPPTSESQSESDDDQDKKDRKDVVLPRLVISDPSINDQELTLSGAEEILSYLQERFPTVGKENDVPGEEASEDFVTPVVNVLRDIGGFFASTLRVGRGRSVSPAAAVGSSAPRPEKPLVLYSYEGNQFCRLVREVLTELDIPYQLRSAGKGSPRRDELAKIQDGSSQCPYLIDPNTGASMPESADIVQYLYQKYALYTPPNELLQWTSDYVMPLAKPLFAVQAPIQAGSTGDDKQSYDLSIAEAKKEIESTVNDNAVVVYTYGLSPFSSETKNLLSSLDVSYKEISLGLEWIPGLMEEGGAQTRAALFEMTNQTSLPHIFVNGKSIGGLFSGTPGLVSSLQDGTFFEMLSEAPSKVEEKKSADIEAATTEQPVADAKYSFMDSVVTPDAKVEAKDATPKESVATPVAEAKDATPGASNDEDAKDSKKDNTEKAGVFE